MAINFRGPDQQRNFFYVLPVPCVKKWRLTSKLAVFEAIVKRHFYAQDLFMHIVRGRLMLNKYVLYYIRLANDCDPSAMPTSGLAAMNV